MNIDPMGGGLSKVDQNTLISYIFRKPMSITTSQQITKWYDIYRGIDVTFTKEIIKATGLEPRQVFVKCVGEQWPCVIYSSSFSGAKIVVSSSASLTEKVKKANNLVSLRFSFRFADKVDPLSFYVAAKIIGFTPYQQGGGDLRFAILHYTQRPPDDLIETIGKLLDANINSARRCDDRILLTPDAMRKICLLSKDSVVMVDGIPRKCIIRDLSFSSSKLIMVGLAKFLVDKDCVLRLEMDEPRESLDIKGTIVRYEDVEGRKDLAAVAIHFSEVPMSYKMHINEYLSKLRQPRVEFSAPQQAVRDQLATPQATSPPPAAEPPAAQADAVQAPTTPSQAARTTSAAKQATARRPAGRPATSRD
jgi:hypothetical protein